MIGGNLVAEYKDLPVASHIPNTKASAKIKQGKEDYTIEYTLTFIDEGNNKLTKSQSKPNQNARNREIP